MKLHRVILAMALAVFALASASFAAEQLAVSPHQATLSLNGSPKNVELEAFCSQTPCNLKWYVLLSNNQVGNIDLTNGPVTHFIAGSLPGSAVVIVQDGQGNMQFSVITVLK